MSGLQKTAVVIGGTSGLGRHVVRQLAARDYRVIFAGRDAARGTRVLEELERARRKGSGAGAFFLPADISQLTVIRELAKRIASLTGHVDVLINNAGVMEPKRVLTPEGFELNFAVHHLAPFATTLELWPLLANSGETPRVINTNSEGHRAALMGNGAVTVDFDDLQMERAYNPFTAYSRSKLMNLLFTYELDRRFGHVVRANALHPGVVKTRLGRHFNPLVHAAAVAFGVPASTGAAPVVALAADSRFANLRGTYFDRFTPVRSSAASYDGAAAQRLFAVTQQLTGLTFA